MIYILHYGYEDVVGVYTTLDKAHQVIENGVGYYQRCANHDRVKSHDCWWHITEGELDEPAN